MKLANGEKLLKEWDIYSYGKIGKRTNCSLTLTNKRLISIEEGRKKILRSETPLSAVKRWSVKSEQKSGLGWIIFGVFLCVTIVGLLFGILCICKGCRLNKEGSFGISFRTCRKNTNSLRRGKTFYAPGIGSDCEGKKRSLGKKLAVGFGLYFLLGLLVDFLMFGIYGFIPPSISIFASTVVVCIIVMIVCTIVNTKQGKTVGSKPTIIKRLRINKAVVNELVEEIGAVIIQARNV